MKKIIQGAFWIFLGLLPAQLSPALIIGTAVKPTGPDAICLVVAVPAGAQGTVQTMIGSGVLINPTTVLTAGHFAIPLKGNTKIQVVVGCGFHPPPNARSLPTLSSFKEAFHPISVDVVPNVTEKQIVTGDNGSDFALVHLEKPSQFQPISVLTSSQSIQEYLSKVGHGLSPVQCAVAGYGIDNNGKSLNLNMGDETSNLHGYQDGAVTSDLQITISQPSDVSAWIKMSSKLDALEKTWARNNNAVQLDNQRSTYEQIVKGVDDEIQFLNSRRLINTNTMPGDSGGPLLCRDNVRAPWKVVGVTSEGGPATTVEDKKVVIDLIDNWVMPSLNNVTQRVWVSTK